MKYVAMIAQILVIIGALNWGLVGIFNWNLVAAIFGGSQPVAVEPGSRVIYVAVGIAAILAIIGFNKIARAPGRSE